MAGSRTMAWVLAALLSGAVPWKAAAAEVQGGGEPAPLADDATLIALAVALSCADAPDAPGAPPAQPPKVAPAGPELELVASVKARAIKFDHVPKVDVVFKGNGPRRTVWKTERVNLPLRPQAGVTYRDVEVRLTITSDVDELTSLIREAKRASHGIRIEPAEAAQPAANPAPPAAAKK